MAKPKTTDSADQTLPNRSNVPPSDTERMSASGGVDDDPDDTGEDLTDDETPYGQGDDGKVNDEKPKKKGKMRKGMPTMATTETTGSVDLAELGKTIGKSFKKAQGPLLKALETANMTIATQTVRLDEMQAKLDTMEKAMAPLTEGAAILKSIQTEREAAAANAKNNPEGVPLADPAVSVEHLLKGAPGFDPGNPKGASATAADVANRIMIVEKAIKVQHQTERPIKGLTEAIEFKNADPTLLTKAMCDELELGISVALAGRS